MVVVHQIVLQGTDDELETVEHAFEERFDALDSTAPLGDISLMRAALDSDLALDSAIRGGTMTTLFRLREGIERFLITDINNPSASMMSQSSAAIRSALVRTASPKPSVNR